MILSLQCSRVCAFDMSKKRGVLPIYLRSVSRKAYLIMMLIKFWATVLSWLSNFPSSTTEL